MNGNAHDGDWSKSFDTHSRVALWFVLVAGHFTMLFSLMTCVDQLNIPLMSGSPVRLE